MEYLNYISIAISVLIICIGIFLIMKKNKYDTENVLAVVTEVKATMVLAVMCAVVALFINISKIMDSSIAGNSPSSYYFTAIFGILAALITVYLIAWTYLKKVIAYSDKVEFISVFGQKDEMKWKDVRTVKTVMLSKKSVFKTDTDSFSVLGDMKMYKHFIEIAKDKVRPSSAKEALSDLLLKM